MLRSIGQTSVEKIRQQLASTLTEKYTAAIFAQINELGKELAQASEGSEKISDGLANISSGTGELIAGMKEQQGRIARFSSGAAELESGAAKLSQGAIQLHNGMTAVNEGIQTLKERTVQLSARSSEFVSGMNQLSFGAARLHEMMQAYGQQHPELQQDSAFMQMTEISDQMNRGMQKVTSAAETLRDGMKQISDSTQQLAEGTKTVHAKLGELAAGEKTLHDSMSALADGARSVTNGWDNVTNHLVALKKGEDELLSGSYELTKKLADGAKRVQHIHAGQPMYQMMANPVRLKEQPVHAVPNYGTGMAPYFLSISLYVGALLLTTVYSLRETEHAPPHALAWFLSKFVILVLISLGQSVIMVVLLTHIVGLQPLYTWQMYLFSLFASLAYMAIVQCLVTVADNVGRFIGIVLLVLQLTASSGTYPVELVPQLLQDVRSLLPMTYTVEGFRVIISTGDFALLRNDIIILGGFMIMAIVFTYGWMWLQQKRNVSSLPALS
ncbi:YhgE/Pip domain-containing protein [Thermaerobacillus caldiproteolyticus]|uniref:Putative membrane protein n=1 Tax=Thermaerobacillus caldiproteolyticus TaxID=247480 RepID=A0A7V9Z9Q4_9BACL|nr:YhgE/Pip domain-containing protein [Anoxybacillus caldiproteolyticus]MBA2876650.1 putative membrane protein [Anoxybacillus caldiproteolyticus]